MPGLLFLPVEISVACGVGSEIPPGGNREPFPLPAEAEISFLNGPGGASARRVDSH